MTSTLTTAAGQPLVESAGPAAAPPPRKRRRRTTAGGAHDDCFTCRNRAVKCDRKRPYCTQCIAIGKECSGYKTTLTWGVGVASRGKLRGLACPIANKNVDGSDITPAESEARKRKASISKAKREDAAKAAAARAAAAQASAPAPTPAPVPAPPAPMMSRPPIEPLMTGSLPTPIPQMNTGWQIPGFHEHLQSRQNEHLRQESFNLPPLQQLQTALNSPYDRGAVPLSGTSMGSFADAEFHSPLEYPHTPGSVAFSDRLPPNPFAEQPTSASADGYSASGGSVDSFPEAMNIKVDEVPSGTMDPSQAELDPMDTMLFNSSDLGYNAFDAFATDAQQGDANEESNDMSLIDPRFSTPFFHLSPRLQSLMDYYDRYICPFLVAFDGPQNPYRKHILQLAVNNEGLQNALAALSTNNLRMRKKPTQTAGFVEELSDSADASDGNSNNEPTPEEAMYKQMSIDQLNMQLTSTSAAQDDSVLATLLILCLFHVCDSGFSKFKTQLAGVQKLLSLRSPTVQSDFTGWVEMFFTWFDVMTSTVNDREMQIKGESLDMLDFSANLGALEQFSGCDGRLFKLIARLGRLNLLAQGRPVKSASGLERTPRLSAINKRHSVRAALRKTASNKGKGKKSLSPLDYEQLDGNGWGTPIISSDEDAEFSADEDADDRHEFWEEYHDVRTRLESWQMDMSSISSSSPRWSGGVAQLDAGQRDLIHINECFRFSALLYTERLGNPVLASSHQQFQSLVSQALFHITALPVSSCVNKFLLWPLFITGTECVDEGHRNIIRTRCIEIQKESGFFNNISGLEVLERVWREVGSNIKGRESDEVKARRRDSEAGQSRGGKYGQAFRWRKAMDRVDGEYIVI